MTEIYYKQVIWCKLKMTEQKKIKHHYMVIKTNGKEWDQVLQTLLIIQPKVGLNSLLLLVKDFKKWVIKNQQCLRHSILNFLDYKFMKKIRILCNIYFIVFLNIILTVNNVNLRK